MTSNLWQTKLAARIHDPAEKALVLLRDPSGHEGGSVAALLADLLLSDANFDAVKKADWWASAADRPQFPRDKHSRYPAWAQVRFADEGELLHPLSGERFKISDLAKDVHYEHIKSVSFDHFRKLIKRNGAEVDHRTTLLQFWRFGPELSLEGIGPLWNLLPADTRTPDHTIWEHLDLTSAFAGAMCDGDTPALLTVSLGPVQDFIAAGRSTSDLWAGSHFLSTLSWQAMKVVAEALGPDAILFPQLRGVPIVDLWLKEKGIPLDRFKECEWNSQNTDYNPLFAAVLPNKFVAIVPGKRGKDLAAAIKAGVRKWVKDEARAMLDSLLSEVDEPPNEQYCYAQLESQLADFPEVNWSLVPWLPANELEAALREFNPPDLRPAFFETIFDTLNAAIEPVKGWEFYKPNDGTLYPALHDLAERVLAAAKSTRCFQSLTQSGYRDSLSGEHEWLTLDKSQLDHPPGERHNTLWTRIAERKPSWANKREHLSATGLIKRVWPTHFVKWIREQGIDANMKRFAISTHVMALAPSLEKLLNEGAKDDDAFLKLEACTKSKERAAVPRRLMLSEYRKQKKNWETATRLPTLIDEIRESAMNDDANPQLQKLNETIEKAIGKSERYYGLILMDGDNLGAWLSSEKTLKFEQSFHSTVLNGLKNYRDEKLQRYLSLNRPASPARHIAISTALNGFSLDLARHVVEDLCLGKLLYSGGDDVMAMVCVRDLPKALWLLRLVYSGGMPGEAGETRSPEFKHDLSVRHGFVRRENKLYRVMGELATASSGAVIAHHMAPLGAVLRNLRAAEKEAKMSGRNAFSLRVLKRSGSPLTLTLPWWLDRGTHNDVLSTMHALSALRSLFMDEMSRRAAYHAVEWIKRFPLLNDERALKNLIEQNIRYQFKRKGAEQDDVALEIADVAVREAKRRCKLDNNPNELAAKSYAILENMLFVAEFLAREDRAGDVPVQQDRARGLNHV